MDEAGRGCLLGPLVVAGVSASRRGVAALKELGVRDSKRLSPRRREGLFSEILRTADRVHWACVAPEEIDDVVTNGRRLRKLNYLEAVYFARVIDRLGAQKVTVDASDVIPGRFGRDISSNLGARCKVVALHKADRDFPLVSAASIVAKVERDREVELLRRAHGDFGSGYPSDPVTRSFFEEWMRRGDPLPPYVRKSWKTWANIEQTLIDSY
ncbi:MAG TPA: ribonuclease HII [Nitrososphaerales archaeon]|nr:ribonuclease HII [Nitrososphaerales archaeon]